MKCFRTPISWHINALPICLCALALALLVPVLVKAQTFTDVTVAPLDDADRGRGVVWFDINSDGLLDLFLTNVLAENRAFVQWSPGVFTPSNVGSNSTISLGVAFADYDNDGFFDFYIANGGQANELYRFDPLLGLLDMTTATLGDTGDGNAVAWADFDDDGDVDLYLANAFQANRLFRNDQGVFVDVTPAPLGDTGNAVAATWGDYDSDGDPDLYITNNGQSNRLLRNDGGGAFTDVTSAPVDGGGPSWGAAWGDYDNDGDLDLYVAHANIPNELYRNDGGGVFTDVTVGPLGYAGWTSNVAWGDYDNDGDLDLHLSNVNVANVLLRNDGGGVFSDVTVAPFGDTGSGAGAAWGDYDSDGDLDLYLANNLSANKLLRNDEASGNHYFHVNLVGTLSNRAAIGARVRAMAGGTTQIREVSGGSGYYSQNSLTVEFGLGTATVVDTLEIRWPSGWVHRLFNCSADQVIQVIENQSLWVDVTSAPLGQTSENAAAWGDYDSDGDLDLFVASTSTSHLYRNEGNDLFTDVPSPAIQGLGLNQKTVGWADYDNDGDLDLCVAGIGGIKLLRNEGGDVFVAIIAFSPVFSNSIAWGDYDNDGLVDIYAGGNENQLYRNRGNDIFELRPDLGGDPSFFTREVAWGDYNGDGNLDLAWANDSDPAQLQRNQGNGIFVDVRPNSFPFTGAESLAWGDYDNDGDLDLYITENGSAASLLQNSSGVFSDVAVDSLASEAIEGDVTWVDYNNDGTLDLFIARRDRPNLLLSNEGGAMEGTAGMFVESVDNALADAVEGYAVAWGDYDNDGDLDVYLGNWGGSERLFRNDAPQNHWLHVKPVGTFSNGSGIGARVRVVAGGWSQLREISGGSRSQSSLAAEFGLGDIATVDTLEVRWPASGLMSIVLNPAVDNVHAVIEPVPSATITSIDDVPGDQGGWAQVRFDASPLDRATGTSVPVVSYDVHRRVDSPSMVAAILTRGTEFDWEGTVDSKTVVPSPGGTLLQLAGRYYRVNGKSSAGAPPGVWAVVGQLSAQQAPQYSIIVPTVGDSSSTISWSVYYVSAHTTTPSIFIDSAPDSGYSVDNIAPGVPQGVSAAYNTGGGNELTWEPAPEPDFQYYRIYRGTDPDFIPAPGNLVHSTASTSWTDTSNETTVSYKVTALDHAGNESAAGSPGTTTAVGGSRTPARDELYQNIPNPFNPSTTIRYALRAPTDVTLTVFDAAGRRVRTLVSQSMPAGVHDVAWDGFDHSGNHVASGVYFYRITAGAFTQTRKMVLLK